jgi:hypothetical protein
MRYARTIVGALAFWASALPAAQPPGIDAPTGAFGGRTPESRPAPPPEPGAATPPMPGAPPPKDARALCQKLAGTERQLCFERARDDPHAPGTAIGGSPGAGGRGDAEKSGR